MDVIVASAETQEEASETKFELGLSMPVGYGLDPVKFAETHRAFYSDDSTYIHATGYLIDSDGVIDIAVYSTGAIGRFTAADALQILEYR